MTKNSQLSFRVTKRTSRLLGQEFPHLLKLPSLGTSSYFASSVGNVSGETVKKYIEEQRHYDTT
jgi:putative transposase